MLNGKAAALKSYEAVKRQLSSADSVGLVKYRTRPRSANAGIPPVAGLPK
jgi:hypothetical protein